MTPLPSAWAHARREVVQTVGLVVVVALLVAGCGGGPSATSEQARASLCLHLVSASAQPAGLLLEALEADLLLLEDAGEDELREQVESIVASIEESAAVADVSVYLTPGLSEGRRAEIEATLADAQGVDEIRYVSEEEELAELTELYGEEFVASIDPASLPASFKLTVRGDVDAVIAAAIALDGVDDVERGGTPALLPSEGRALIDETCPAPPVGD